MSDSKPTVPQTRPEDRVPLRDKIIFTSGVLTAGQSVDIFNRMLIPVFQITLGVSPVLVGMVQTIMRLWDAITDPLVASWSDNTRTRWGRRRPFIFVGCVLIAVLYPFIWMPSETWQPKTIATYLAIMALVFITAHTIYNIAYEALGVELTADTNERTRVYAFRSYLPPVIGLAGGWLYAFIQSDYFKGPMHGMQVMGWLFAGLFLVTGLLPAIFLQERRPAEIARQQKIPLLKSLRAAFSNRAFLCVGAILLLGQLAANTFAQFALYAQIYVLYGGNTKSGAIISGWVSVVHFVVFMSSIGIGAKLAQRYSKRTVMFIGAAFTFLAGVSKLVIYNPKYPYLVLLSPVLSAPAGAIAAFIVNAMMADVAFYDQWKTGERREAIYTGVGSWLYKCSLSLSGVLQGLLLVAIGFDRSLGGNQSEFTKTWLVLGMVLMGVLPALITVVAMLFYPLTPGVMERCRREIEERDRQAGIA